MSANLFPARVTEPDGAAIHSNARVVEYADHGLIVWVAPGRTPVPVLSAPNGTYRIQRLAKGHHEIVVTDGDIEQRWDVRVGGGCGCGHPLKGRIPPHPNSQRRAVRSVAAGAVIPEARRPAPTATTRHARRRFTT